MTRSTDDLLAELLAECTDLIIAGATVDACLERYPEHAAALKPMLSTLVQVRQLRPVPPRPAEVMARSRAQFMAAAQRVSPSVMTPQAARTKTWSEHIAAWWLGVWARPGWLGPAERMPRGMPAGLLASLLIVILSGLLATGVLATSARALPGDFLYPVKIGTESVWMLLQPDPIAREEVRKEFADRRVEEAKAVVELGRPVPSMALEGTIEAIYDDTWTVSGLIIDITADTRIEGQPTVGARIQGRMHAPGDGRLVALYIEVETPLSGELVPLPTPIATVTTPPTDRPLTATPTSTPSRRASDSRAAMGFPTQSFAEPADRPTRRPSPSPTVRPTKTPWSSLTPTATVPLAATVPLTSTPTPSPAQARPDTKVRIEGWVNSIDGDLWTVDGTTFTTDGGTKYIGNPGVGWRVSALLRVEPNGSYTALQITAISGPEASPEPLEFTDVVKATDGEWWTIGSYQVKITGDTKFEGDPKIGDLASVKAQRRTGGEIWALKISAVRDVEVQFQGRVDAINSDSLVIDGHVVFLDGQTKIIGRLEVGCDAQVSAKQMPDGRLIARVVVVMEPEPTPTPMPTPTSTPTAEPTRTATPEPTATATSEPTATATSEPTATATPEPTSTPTLPPTETSTPEPTATTPAEPTSTATLAPTETLTSEPTLTPDLAPTETSTPELTETALMP
jgi:hypothetical protein